MNALEHMKEKEKAIWEMNTFLEKFKAYHELMAFGGLDRKIYEENIKSHPNYEQIKDRRIEEFNGSYGYSYFIEDTHLESLEEYCTFLNNIPTKQHKEEVDRLLRVFCNYSAFFREYDVTYADTYDEYDNRTVVNMSDKRKKDIKLAKEFRDSLRGNQLSTNDYGSYAKDYDWLKEEGKLSTWGDFPILVASLTRYIDDLETKKHNIRSKRDYQNFFPKPSVMNLISHIKTLVKQYDITGTTSSINEFQRHLNDYKT